ncbi:hypothetical protein M501DRAFT_1015709 [Patellaria atrata CBS 101060]|uniref:Uncharacterized protein n=1 Tax=Patellaria atrata CBS 101060 TaxID=1346257 RepID=A0A9P4SBJ0_9PEZI|nr:hypothetical protein M501DRAFT_1015709 [Patellaria atrata CBS 101060]
MAPMESSILSNFLLTPAPLKNVVTLKGFRELFPRSLQSNAQIDALYRELQHERLTQIDNIKQNIAAEAKRGERLRKETVKARRKADVGPVDISDRDIQMEIELFGPSANHPPRKHHTIDSMRPELEQACRNIEEDLEAMDAEATTILQDISATIGDLSDLRYGKFSKTAGVGDELGQEVLESLKALNNVCTEYAKG